MANYTLFKLRGNTRANWLADNPILNNRELAMETDTMRFKVGDGLATYSQLPYGRNTGEYLNFYNVTAFLPLPAGYYYTHDAAISNVVANERCKGQIVSYEVSSGVWYTERFIGTDVANWGVLANWEQMPDSSDFTALHDVITAYNNHALNKSNPHTVTKDQIGLGNAANTSDLDKPISTATQNALDNKVNVSGDQTIYGVKSFYTSPTVPNPTENNDAVNKATLDLHKNDSTNPHQVTKLQVGLGNADNTSDADKPISSATQTALNLKENTANKGAINGYASLDETGKVPTGQLPSYVDDVLEYANLASFPASGEQGKIYVALDTNKTYRWSGSTYIYITSGAVDSVAGKTGVVSLVKGDVGLGNVDNTSDADKTVSTAQQTALNSKVSKTGAETIADLKTFTTIPQIPTADPTLDAQVASKKYVDAKDAQLGADLNTSIADEKSMFPAIAYNKRVLADGGTVISKQSVIDGYKTMIDLLPNTKLLFCPQAGVKTRTSGLYSYLAKAYDIGVNGLDLTQNTEANQPFINGFIAPNENKYLKSNINSAAKTISHTAVSFLSTDAFSFILSVKPNTVGANQKINISSSSYITINSNGLTLYNGTSNILSTSSILEIGKNSIVEFKYSNGTGLIKINGVPVTTTVISGAISFDRISTQATYFDGCIYYSQIFNKYLSEFESKNTYSYLRSQYPEIEGVAIGNQMWSTSNYEGVVTGNGTVIPEVQGVTTAGNPELVTNGTFDSDTNWTKDSGWTISGGSANCNGVGSNNDIKQNITFIIEKSYQITYTISNYISGIFQVFIGGSNKGAQRNSNGTFVDIVTYRGTQLNTLFLNSKNFIGSIDNVSVKEVGWADLTTPAWCYYNNDPVLGSVYGKLYNYYAVQEIAKNPPKGWRVPTSADFVQLSTFLGGDAVSGGKLKKEGLSYWDSPNAGATNESGFSVIGGGHRNADSSFNANKTYASFWSIGKRILVATDSTFFNATVFDEQTRGRSLRLLRNSPVGDQVQNISTGVFTTNITGGVYKDLQIPFGYQVDAIILNAATNITNFKCDLYNYGGGTLQGNILTGKTATTNVPIKYSVLADIPVQFQDSILRFSCTKTDTAANIDIQIVISKIL